MPSKLSATLELSVECLWHRQIHGRPVTALAVSPDDTLIFSACDLSAPCVGDLPDASERQPAVVALSCRDGSRKGSLHCAPDTDVSSIHLDESTEDAQIWCIDGTGSAWTHAFDTRHFSSVSATELQMTAAWQVSKAAMAHTSTPSTSLETLDAPSNASRASDAVHVDATSLSCLPVEETSKAIRGTADSTSTELEPSLSPSNFQPASGYRGVREGFVFRNGPWGKGYYSKKLLAEGNIHTVAGNEDFRMTSKEISAPVGATGDNIQEVQLLTQEASGHEGESQAPEDNASIFSPHISRNVGVPEDVKKRRDHINYLAKPKTKVRFSLLTDNRQLLVTGSCGLEDSAARLWLAKTGAPLGELRGHTGNVLEGTLSPDQCTLYTGAYDGLIKEWDLINKKFVRDFRGHRSGIRGLITSPDGANLYSCAADNTIRHWDLTTGLCRRSFYGRHSDSTWPVCICIAPDGHMIATGSNGLFGESTIKVFHATGTTHRDAGKCLATICHFDDRKGSVSALAFSKDSKTLISAGTDGSVAAWRLTWSSRQLGRSQLKGGFL